MTGSLSQYALIHAKLRARISLILGEDFFDRLDKATSLEAALALLRDTPFDGLESLFSRTGDLKLLELELLKIEIALYRDITQYLHRESLPLLEALLVRFEIDNLKNALRVYFDRQVRQRAVDSGQHYVLLDPIVHELPMDVILNAESFDEIAGLCQETPYQDIILKYGRTVERQGSLFRLEIALDHAYYQNLHTAIHKLKRSDRKIALRLAGVEIDLQNISWLIRFKRFYDLSLDAILPSLVPGGFNLNRPLIEELYQSTNVTSTLTGLIRKNYPELADFLGAQVSGSTARLRWIQRLLEEIQRQEVKRIMSGYPFTIGILLAYLILKGDETRRIRTILNAKHVGSPPEQAAKQS